MCSRSSGHPRRHRRGRIEGPFLEGVLRRRAVVTHGVTAVAELKGSTSGSHCSSSYEVTHGVTAVAELKAKRSTKQQPKSPGHPRRHRRGRIEGTSFIAILRPGEPSHPRRHRRGRIEGGEARNSP